MPNKDQHARVRFAPALAVAVVAGALAIGAQLGAQQQSQQPKTGDGFNFGGKKPPIKWDGPRRMEPVAKNMKLVGWTDMNGRPDGEQVTGQVINGRDYIFYGHYWSQGVSIVDVTDPAKPQTVAFIPVQDPYGKFTKVQVSGTVLMVPIRSLYEIDGERPVLPRHGVLFFDVSDPRNPKQLSYFKTADRDENLRDGVHFSWFASKYAYLSAPVSGYRGHVYMIVDVSDPKNPKEAGRFWSKGQHVAGGETYVQDEVPTTHGAQANRDETLGFSATLGDPPGGLIILDIRDKANPKPLSRLDMSPPMPATYFGVHNVVTMDSRKLLVCMNEGTGAPRSKAQQTGWVVDYSDPTKPIIQSILPIPPNHDMDRPARFGPHNAHENHPNGLIDDWMLYISWFSRGVRVFDLSDPRHPAETGFFEPPDPKARIDARTWKGKPGDPNGSELSSLNHVYVDKRGYIYASGYNDGLYILEYTGPRPQGSQTALQEGRRERQRLGAAAQD